MTSEEVNDIGVKPTFCSNCKEKTISRLSEDKTHYYCPKCGRTK